MKKTFAILCLLVCLITFCFAEASVPSKTVSDMLQPPVLSTVNGVELPEGFYIKINDDPEFVVDELAKIVAHVREQQLPVVTYFNDPEIQAEIAASLPEGFDLTTMVSNEIFVLTSGNYVETIGDVEASFVLPTVYVDGTNVVVLQGFLSSIDENGEPVIDWQVLKSYIKDSQLVILFDKDTIIRMQYTDSMIVVLSEPTVAE